MAPKAAQDFPVLADLVRLRLLSLLVSDPAGEAYVCELVELLARLQPTVSHHLEVLADAGLTGEPSLKPNDDRGAAGGTTAGRADARWVRQASDRGRHFEVAVLVQRSDFGLSVSNGASGP